MATPIATTESINAAKDGHRRGLGGGSGSHAGCAGGPRGGGDGAGGRVVTRLMVSPIDGCGSHLLCSQKGLASDDRSGMAIWSGDTRNRHRRDQEGQCRRAAR